MPYKFLTGSANNFFSYLKFSFNRCHFLYVFFVEALLTFNYEHMYKQCFNLGIWLKQKTQADAGNIYNQFRAIPTGVASYMYLYKPEVGDG